MRDTALAGEWVQRRLGVMAKELKNIGGYARTWWGEGPRVGSHRRSTMCQAEATAPTQCYRRRNL
jgi:hypothetical protein